MLPSLLILTDEHFSCPPGFVQILDISYPRAMQVLSTIHVAGVDDQYDHAAGKFVCPPGQQSAHLPYFDPRGHGSLYYQAWYDQGLRAFDISNPFSPKEVGFFVSPDFSVPAQVGRHTREAYVDPATNLIYVTDGNGGVALGSVLVLLLTGPLSAYNQRVTPAVLGATAYGQSLLLKLGLLVPLLGLAAVNRLGVRRRIARGDTGAPGVGLLRRLARAELVLAAAVLLSVALLASLPPAGLQEWPAPVEVARQAGDLRVALAVNPNWVGVSRFRVTLADATGLPPPNVRRVTLTFTMDGMNMGRTHVSPTPRAPGVWEAEGFYIGMPGVARVGVVLRQNRVRLTWRPSVLCDGPRAAGDWWVVVPTRGAAGILGPSAPPLAPGATAQRRSQAVS